MSSRFEPVTELAIETKVGAFVACYTSKGLCGLHFPRFSQKRLGTNLAQVPVEVQKWHAAVTVALEAALKGERARNLPPLDLSTGTEFQRQVWAALSELKPGQTVTYGELAKSIGRPNAVRAVGGACGANPVPVLVPCHRVLAAGDKLGGFSGGLDWKLKLLHVEGVVPGQRAELPA